MKVFAFTSGVSTPSTRFRVRQNISALEQHDVEVLESYPFITQKIGFSGKFGSIRGRYILPIAAAQVAMNAVLRLPGFIESKDSDVIWIERSFIPGFEYPVKFLKRPIVLDMDDAIWLSGFAGRSVPKLVASVDMTTVGNDYLATWVSKYCKNIEIVPTGIDCKRFFPNKLVASNDHDFNIGWTGTSGNFKYLKTIENALAKFLKRNPSAIFTVIADKMPSMPSLPPKQFFFKCWSAVDEPELINQFDCGIMPLVDSEWAKGKCSFKLIQYMACGLPVIASPVGMNIKVVTEGGGLFAHDEHSWYDALEDIYRNRGMAATMAERGRTSILRTYDTAIVAKKLADVFKSLI